MGDINKYFGGIDYNVDYDYKDKKQNITNYVKYMLNRSLAMFKYHDLPETIPQRELELMLQCSGYGIICEVDGDLYCLSGALGGVGNAYNRPTQATIVNPYLKFNKTLELDSDCILFQNDSMLMGLIPIYERYCTMLNESDITIILATINKRIQILLSASDDNTVQSAKQFISDIEGGKLGVIAETKLFDSLKVNQSSTGNNVNLRDLMEMHQYIKASLFNEIGLGAANNMKKEQMITSEVESNADNLYPLVDDMLENRREAIKKVNDKWGTEISVEFNSSWDYRLFNGEPIDTTPDEESALNDNVVGSGQVDPQETSAIYDATEKEGESVDIEESEQGAENQDVHLEKQEGNEMEQDEPDETIGTDEPDEPDETEKKEGE